MRKHTVGRKRRIAVIAQAADPRLGSEFATGWGAVNQFYLQSPPEDMSVDIYISEYRGNREFILENVAVPTNVRLLFIPLVLPRLHRRLGRAMRIAWQIRVAWTIQTGGYDAVHQVSPNSIVYLNPIFLLKAFKGYRLIGPMRSEAAASVAQWYAKHLPTVLRQASIRLKEAAESVMLLYHRRAVSLADLHICPIAAHLRRDNQVYCRETALVDVCLPTADARPVKYLVLWSGQGDVHRKNAHLASDIIAAAEQEQELAEFEFRLLGDKIPSVQAARIESSAGVPRADLLNMLTPGTIYLLTSLLELNSVLAEEVLQRGGRVVAGPLPSFAARAATSGVHVVENYTNVSEWVGRLIEAKRLIASRHPTSHASDRATMLRTTLTRIKQAAQPATGFAR